MLHYDGLYVGDTKNPQSEISFVRIICLQYMQWRDIKNMTRYVFDFVKPKCDPLKRYLTKTFDTFSQEHNIDDMSEKENHSCCKF